MGDFNMMIRLGALVLLLSIVAEAYNETLPNGNKTQIAMADMSYGTHIFALSKEGYLIHQVGHMYNLSDPGVWQLMPNPHAGSTPAGQPQTFDSDPAVGQNKDGRLEIIMRNHIGLDFWHWYQVNASDPWTWVGPREPACLCNFPPCAGQTKCGNNANCGNDGYDCSAPENSNDGPKWWNSQAVFPTNNPTFIRTKDDKLKIYFRGFDGQMYSVQQVEAGNSTKYTSPDGYGTLLEWSLSKQSWCGHMYAPVKHLH